MAFRSSALAAGCGIAAAWAVRGRSSSVFGPSVWRGPRDRKAIALTFDDGPTPSTPQVVDLLARYQAPATFFQVGTNVLRHAEIARSVHAAGHEIGNHSHTHPNFALKSAVTIDTEFARAQAAIEETTGARPTLLRAPYGVRWHGFRDIQARLGLTGVMWTVIGLDWKLPAEAIAERVLSRAGNGGIICLHDGRALEKNPDIGATLGALRLILPALREAGYHFDTVSGLLCPHSPKM